jgi:hypothetical protein
MEKVKNTLKKFRIPIASVALVMGLIVLATFGSTWGDHSPAEPENPQASTSSIAKPALGAKDYDELIVYFDSNGGTDVPPEVVYSGNSVTKPDDPTKDGYTFDAWYSDPGLTQPYDFGEQSLAKSATETSTHGAYTMVLYAKWLTNYTVTFDGMTSPNTPPAPQVVPEGFVATDPGGMPNFTTQPYNYTWTFAGWYTIKSPTPFDPQFDFANTPITSDITLYAKWVFVEN